MEQKRARSRAHVRSRALVITHVARTQAADAFKKVGKVSRFEPTTKKQRGLIGNFIDFLLGMHKDD